MANIIVTKEKEHSWDVSVWENGKRVKTAWAMNRDQAIGKAEILADYYRSEVGQSSGIVICEK